MKRSTRVIVITLIIVVLMIFAGCQRGSSSVGTSGTVEISLISNKIEIDGALKAYAAVYERQTGVRVNVRSIGGESPYAPALAAMFSAGDEPEIFVIEGKAGYDDAERGGRLTDLSGEPWVADTDVAYRDPSGRVVGFPVAIEGWGLGYNKAILERAGINPATLTNVAAIRAAFERIDSMRGELGLEGVVSMAAGPGMEWVTGLHGVNAYLTLGLPYNDSTQLINMLNNGQVDTARLTSFAEYYNLLFQYSIRNNLVAGGYDAQIGSFATQRTAFIHQGNWTDPDFRSLGVSFQMAYVPHAFLTENTDGIFVGPPSWYIVNARSPNVEAAKQFLRTMASTPEGHNYMVNEAGMVPAFKSVRLSPSGEFSKSVQEWASQGKIYAWQQNEMPDGFGMGTLGPIFHQLASGQITVARFVELFANAVATLR